MPRLPGGWRSSDSAPTGAAREVAGAGSGGGQSARTPPFLSLQRQYRGLFQMVLVLGIGGSFPYGFHISVINYPSLVSSKRPSLPLRGYMGSLSGPVEGGLPAEVSHPPEGLTRGAGRSLRWGRRSRRLDSLFYSSVTFRIYFF